MNIELTDSNGNKVVGIASIPRSAASVAVLSHGYSSNKDSRIYRELSDELNSAGIGTVRYDYYGHGPAYGHGPGYGASPDVTLSKAVGSLDAVLGYLRQRDDFSIGLVGSSFGGLLSLIAASREDPDIHALALKSPVTEPVRFWRDRINALGADIFDRWERDGVMHYREGIEDYDLTWQFWLDLQNYDSLTNARDVSCPVLIMHRDRDSCVPIEQSYELAKTLCTEVTVVRGADHGYEKPEQYDDAKRLLRDFMVANL